MKDIRNHHSTGRNNCFVNLQRLPLLCEISEAVHVAQPGLTAGRQTKSK